MHNLRSRIWLNSIPKDRDNNFVPVKLGFLKAVVHDLENTALDFNEPVIISSDSLDGSSSKLQLSPPTTELRSTDSDSSITSVIDISPTIVDIYGKVGIQGWINGLQWLGINESTGFYLRDNLGFYVGILADVSGNLTLGDTDDGKAKIYIDTNSNNRISFSGTNKINLATISAYANNAAAIAGGLSAGDIYYTDSAGEYILKIAH